MVTEIYTGKCYLQTKLSIPINIYEFEVKRKCKDMIFIYKKNKNATLLYSI